LLPSGRQDHAYQHLSDLQSPQINPSQEFIQRHAPPTFPVSIHCSQQNHLLAHVSLLRRRALVSDRLVNLTITA
jgi:hypothetical protein